MWIESDRSLQSVVMKPVAMKRRSTDSVRLKNLRLFNSQSLAQFDTVIESGSISSLSSLISAHLLIRYIQRSKQWQL